VKIAGDVAADIARIEDVEANRKPDEIILYDVNRGWTRQQALRVLSAVEHLNIMVEQPAETLDDIAAIAGKHATPVSVDESLVTLQDAARIARDGVAEIFGIKLNRVGGHLHLPEAPGLGVHPDEDALGTAVAVYQ
jgi:L-alanine-DL-glutamate epimerase-like enolase superfamily enzyme